MAKVVIKDEKHLDLLEPMAVVLDQYGNALQTLARNSSGEALWAQPGRPEAISSALLLATSPEGLEVLFHGTRQRQPDGDKETGAYVCCCAWGAAIATKGSGEWPEAPCIDCPHHGEVYEQRRCKRHKKEEGK